MGLSAEAEERDLRKAAARESGSAPASRRAPDLDSDSAAGAHRTLGRVQWSPACRLPATPGAATRAPGWTRRTTSGLETE